MFVSLLSVPQKPPLYLHITSTSKDGLERAVAKIEELMKQELPNLVDERRFRRREPDQVERDEFGRVCFFGVVEILGIDRTLAQMAGRTDSCEPRAHCRIQSPSTSRRSWRSVCEAYSG